MSGLAGSLKPRLCLPVFFPTLSLQINVFACSAAVGLRYLRAFHSEVRLAFAESREEHAWQDAMGGLPVVHTRVQGCSGFRRKACGLVGAESCMEHLFFQKHSSGRHSQ